MQPATRQEARRGRPFPTTSARADSLRELAAELARRRAEVVDGDARATRRQHAKGKLTARERIDLLLDPGTFPGARVDAPAPGDRLRPRAAAAGHGRRRDRV